MKLLYEVKEKVNRPFSTKLAETRKVIAHHFQEFGDKVGVAFSGGNIQLLIAHIPDQEKK